MLALRRARVQRCFAHLASVCEVAAAEKQEQWARASVSERRVLEADRELLLRLQQQFAGLLQRAADEFAKLSPAGSGVRV